MSKRARKGDNDEASHARRKGIEGGATTHTPASNTAKEVCHPRPRHSAAQWEREGRGEQANTLYCGVC